MIRCCLDGIEIDESSVVLGSDSEAIRDLCAAGEVAGEVYGNNRLGGFFLLECVVFGRVAGAACAKYKLGDKVDPTLLAELSDGRLSEEVEVFKLANGSSEGTIVSIFLSQHPGGESATLTVARKDATSEFDMIRLPDVIHSVEFHEENHLTKKGDVWVAVHGRALNVSNFLSQHRDDEVDVLPDAGKDAYRTDRTDRYRKVGIPVIGRLSCMVLAFMREIIPAMFGQMNIVLTDDRAGLAGCDIPVRVCHFPRSR